MKNLYPFLRSALYGILLVAASGFTVSAQLYTKQVIIVSGGQFGNPDNYVRVGAYNPQTRVYTVFDSLRAASTRTVITDEAFAYVTADTLIAKYNLDTYSRVALGNSGGLNSPGGGLAVYDNFLLATRGGGADSDFVHVYNKNDLSLAHTIKGISNQAAGIVVVGDTAYVAVAGPWGKDTGTIAVINLKTMQLNREIMLDTLGAGIGKLFTDGNNIYAISSGRNIINKLEVATGNVTNTAIENNTIYNGSGLDNNMLYVDVDFMGIGAYNTTTGTFTNTKLVSFEGINTFTEFVSGSIYDHVEKRFYVTSTDYFSKGTAFVFTETGVATDTFAVGVSPEAIALDHRLKTSIYSPAKKWLSLQVYPNPAASFVNIDVANAANSILTITDATGRAVATQQLNAGQNRLQLNVQHLPVGIYNISIQSNNSLLYGRFIKQ